MKINTKDINVQGTTLVGQIEISYFDLVSLFGEPKQSREKTSAIWDIEFDDSVVASIYDWKPGKNDTPETTKIWNIGGFYKSKQHVIEYISKEIKKDL